MDASESLHRSVAAAWERLILDGHRLVTSNYVITETIALTQARIGLKAAHAFLERVEESVEIAWVDRPCTMPPFKNSSPTTAGA